jgi:hypothetical protein
VYLMVKKTSAPSLASKYALSRLWLKASRAGLERVTTAEALSTALVTKEKLVV